MSQTIDLRKKKASEQPPIPVTEPHEKAAESVRKETPILESVEEEAPIADTLAWKTAIHRPLSKPAALYIASILFGAGILSFLLKQDPLFSVILVLLGIVLILISSGEHKHSHVHVDRTGISIDGQKYLYHEVGSFWIDYQPPHTKELSIQFKRMTSSPLRIPLEEVNPLEIRAAMIQFIPEKEHQQSLLDHFIRQLRS